MSLSTRITVFLGGAIILLGGAGMLLSGLMITAAIHGQVLEKISLKVDDLRPRAAALMVVKDTSGLRDLLETVPESLPEVRALYATGFRGELLAHTFAGAFPAGLLADSRLRRGAEYGERDVRIAGREFEDHAWRVVPESATEVHLLLAREDIRATGYRVAWMLALVLGALLACVVTCWLLLRRFTRPLSLLAAEAGSFASSGRYREVAARGGDEVGQLTRAFNAMAATIGQNMRDLARKNEELQAMDRMREGLMRDVCHELKTPVAKLSMQIQMMREVLRKHGLEAEVRQQLEVAERSIARQERTIRNILDLKRLEQGGRRYQHRRVRLDGLLEDIVRDMAESTAGRALRVEESLLPLEVDSDREMLWHAFANLVDNAVKYAGGRPDSLLRIAMEKLEGRVEVSFQDNGRGMSAAELERAFEPFFQASAAHEGSGVGLSITKRILEDLGGSISVSSGGPDRGFTAVVSLPLGQGGQDAGDPGRKLPRGCAPIRRT